MSRFIEKYDQVIMKVKQGAIAEYQSLPESLLIGREGALNVYYAPFDWVNTEARVIIMGLTPGMTQAVEALNAYRSAREAGASMNEAHRIAKQTGAFSGKLRSNLVQMLDHIGLNRWLGIDSCASLFGEDAPNKELVHSMSGLPFPVLKNGGNYNGTPGIKGSPLLRDQLKHCANLLGSIADVPIITLGEKVEKAMDILVKEGAISENRLIKGLVHPSGANAERIAYFLGRKSAHELSAKTRPDIIDKGREAAIQKIESLLR